MTTIITYDNLTIFQRTTVWRNDLFQFLDLERSL